MGVTVAAVFACGIALLSGQVAPSTGDVGRFAIVGAIAPGSSQGLFVAAIGLIGPSRTSVLVGTSPVFSVLLAILFLGEGWQAAIVLGTLLTVLGSALIGWESGVVTRSLGVVFALATALSFGVRDAVARQFNIESDVSSWWSGGIVLAAAALVLTAAVLVRERGKLVAGITSALPEFLASGVMIGVALPTLLGALDRGKVGTVAPLALAAQNITVIVLSAFVFGATERSPRVVGALVLVLAGATLITSA